MLKAISCNPHEHSFQHITDLEKLKSVFLTLWEGIHFWKQSCIKKRV